MNFNLNQIREQFPALAQYYNDRPVTFLMVLAALKFRSRCWIVWLATLDDSTPTLVVIISQVERQLMSCNRLANRHKLC